MSFLTKSGLDDTSLYDNLLIVCLLGDCCRERFPGLLSFFSLFSHIFVLRGVTLEGITIV